MSHSAGQGSTGEDRAARRGDANVGGRRNIVAYDDLDSRPRPPARYDGGHYEQGHSERRTRDEWPRNDDDRDYGRTAEYEGWRSHWREDGDGGRRAERSYNESSRYEESWGGQEGDQAWEAGRRYGDGSGRDHYDDRERQGRYGYDDQYDRGRWEHQGREGERYYDEEPGWHQQGRYDTPSTSSRWAGRGYPSQTEDGLEGDYAYGGRRERGGPDRQDVPPPATQMRLVKLSSDVIPEDQHIAIVDAKSDPVSIGRDRSFTARLRLPAMEISKHHANLFWMPSQGRSLGRFQITDTGSTHGTFILPQAQIPQHLAGEGCAADEATEKALAELKTSQFQRLAEPKKANAPRDIGHGDLLRLGKTTMQVHLHPGGLACALCGVGGESGRSEIPLLPNQQGGNKAQGSGQPANEGSHAAGAGQESVKVTADASDPSSSGAQSQAFTYGGDRKVESEMVRRSRMKELRATYLGADEAEESEKRERMRDNWKKKKEKERAAKAGEAIKVLGAEEGKGSKGGYVDRAAQRRALQGSLPPTSGEAGQRAKVVIAGPRTQAQASSTNGVSISSTAAGETTSSGWKPAAALDGRNKGFQLYARMGVPSTSEAKVDSPAVEEQPETRHQAPIEARGVTGRAGLGAAKLLSVEELGRSSAAPQWHPGGARDSQDAKAKARDYVERGMESARRRLESEMGRGP